MMQGTTYGTSHLKRERRTKVEMEVFYSDLRAIVQEQAPMTVRQVFYQGDVRGLVEKAETGYHKGQRALMEMRSHGSLPFSWIVDNTRWQRKPTTYDSVDALLNHAAASYRRTVWAELDQRVEVWCEKDALAGVILPVTAEYDVPLLVARGYSSASFIYSAAEAITEAYENGLVTYVYHLGDFDPSGQDAARDIRVKLTMYAPVDSFVFKQIAVTPAQIHDYQLPTRPTKQTDTRAKGFGAISVELDALPSNILRSLVRAVIEAHLPPGHMDGIRFVEAEERRQFTAMMNGHRT